MQLARTQNDETPPARPASRRGGLAAAVTLTALALVGAGPAAAADLMPGPSVVGPEFMTAAAADVVPGPSAVGPEFVPAAAADVVPGPSAVGPDFSLPFEPNAVAPEI